MTKKRRTLDRARDFALWKTREGFVVQIRAMSDYHLLNLLMKLLNAARKELYNQTTALYIVGETPESTTAYKLATENNEIIVDVVAELRYRDILDKLPETF